MHLFARGAPERDRQVLCKRGERNLLSRQAGWNNFSKNRTPDNNVGHQIELTRQDFSMAAPSQYGVAMAGVAGSVGFRGTQMRESRDSAAFHRRLVIIGQIVARARQPVCQRMPRG